MGTAAFRICRVPLYSCELTFARSLLIPLPRKVFDYYFAIVAEHCRCLLAFTNDEPSGSVVTMLWELTILIVIAAAEEYTVTKLPSLEIRSNVAYFERHRNTLLNCTVSPGWSAARATDVYWLKDGVPVTELHELASLYHIKNGSLSIGWTRFETEGDYQCSAMVKNIELGDKRVIDTRLVSAPVNYKRARLTKFDDFEEQMIRITQEQLTRIPCFGMPDVVPSPAVMWFEKEGDEAVHLGLTSERRFVVTLTGLQIALVQPSDAGNYYCVVRNPYTNHTRRAPKPTVLVVNSRHGFGRVDPPRNSIEFPLEGRSAKNPIVIHASVGQTILLECVTSHSSVKWTKGNNTVSIFEMENPHRVYEKVWGNLRLRSLVALDSDIYVCHALSPFDSDHKGLSDGHAKVYYQLYVHVPTTAQLNLEQESDDIWRLVCYAGQQFYEVPMVYLNGFPLIDRSHILADGHERVAESNPLNVTLKGNTLKGTSVQCISRAAMVEAEVYGRGLERGEAVNFYVDVVRNETDEKQPERNESGVPIDYNATVIATLSTGEVGQVNRPDLPENRMNVATTQSSEDYASTEMKAVNSIIDRLLSISPSIGLTFVLLFVSSTVALCFIMTFCCLGCYRFKEWYDRRFSKAAKGKFLDTSQRIFNEQLLQRSRTLQEQQSKLMTPLIRHPSSSTQGNAKTALDSSISMIGHQETPSFYGSSEENHHQGSIPGEDMTESTQSFLKAGGFYKSRPGRALFSSEWHDGAKPTKNELLTMSATLPHPFSNSQGSPREYDSQSAHSGQNALSTFQSSSPFRKANN
uniref:Ig-like domain-containing protein n=1 Tax=Steinernema glaseri TaxID=37863 RepID=A0A1I7Z4Z8_9BILA